CRRRAMDNWRSQGSPRFLNHSYGETLRPAGLHLPQGDKVLRKEDHQAFVREFIFEIKGGKHRILETVEKENTYSCRHVNSTCRHVNSPPPKPRGVPVMSGTA